MKRGMIARNILLSDFYCTQCGQKNISIPRKKGKAREPGHLKNIFCLNCQKETNHVEIKQNNKNYTFEDFVTEYEYDNFDLNGKRKEKYGELRSKIHNGQIKKKKTFFNGGSAGIW